MKNEYCSPCVILVLKCRKMRWAQRVARMGERRGSYRVFGGETLGKETTWNN